MKQAPNAGREAKRVWDKGYTNKELLLSLEDEVSVEDAIRNSFAFIQIYGMQKGESKKVACVSNGLSWDRQRPMEDGAQEIVKGIGGGNAYLVWFGPHKLVGFITEDRSEMEMLDKLVDVPRSAYKKHFPNLFSAQSEIQDRRRDEIEGGIGRTFSDIFTSKEDGLKRAYRDNGKYSFVWGYTKGESIEGKEELWATNLDNQPQSLTSLASGSPDQETRDMLFAIQNFFQGNSSKNRYVIEFDFSSTVACCNISFNAQQTKWASDANSYIGGFADGWEDYLMYPNGEQYKKCKDCKKEKCECKKKINLQTYL